MNHNTVASQNKGLFLVPDFQKKDPYFGTRLYNILVHLMLAGNEEKVYVTNR